MLQIVCSSVRVKLLARAKSIFHLLEAVSRYRDPQLQVGENYSYVLNLRPNICKKCKCSYCSSNCNYCCSIVSVAVTVVTAAVIVATAAVTVATAAVTVVTVAVTVVTAAVTVVPAAAGLAILPGVGKPGKTRAGQ